MIDGSKVDGLVVIDGVPYTYTTSYAKKEFHGTAMPTAYGSFGVNVAWKSFNLNTLFTYSLGGKVLDYNYQSLMSVGSTPANLHKDALKSWTQDQATTYDAVDPNGLPMLNYAAKINSDVSASLYSTSSRWLTSASYLILKNINLSYQLPKNLVRKADMENVTVTVACENLFTKTSRQGMNPQMSYAGTQSNYLVTPRVFSVGLNVRF